MVAEPVNRPNDAPPWPPYNFPDPNEKEEETSEEKTNLRVLAMEPRAGFDPATCRFLAELQGGRSLVRLICQAEPPRRTAEYEHRRLKFSRRSPLVTFSRGDERCYCGEVLAREH